MPAVIRIYYEGSKLLKPGFDAFFSDLKLRARERKVELRLIASDSGTNAWDDFQIALKANPKAWNLLLVDSEGCSRTNRPNVFWMIEMMESWFHADKERLEKFYGAGFNRNALKANPRVEQIPKKDVIAGLRGATKNTQKGDYFDHKTEHGPRLLEMIRPSLVRKAAPDCERLFRTVLGRLEAI
jgi:Domain of unknown function (DUF4276)